MPETLPPLLVVDDDPLVRSLVAATAERCGYEVRQLADAVELDAALGDDLLADPSAVIVLDLAMPGMDGVQAMRLLAGQGFRGRVVLVSGFDPRVLDAAARVGESRGLRVSGRLTKPFRTGALRAALSAGAGAPPVAPVLADPGLVTADELLRAIHERELVVHYQPQARLDNHEIVGIEALVRWQHPLRGLLYPDRFIPVAEREGLALPLTEAVLAQTIESYARLGRDGVRMPPVSVNLPPEALTDVELPDRVIDLLARSAVPIDLLTFEITETSVAREPVTALDILTRLRLKGIRLSIDDFGTGYSSMAQLRRLPFSELKIDMGFVRHLSSDASCRAIVDRTIALGHDLDLTVLAEGVETRESWQALSDAGCDLAQGWYIARAAPQHELARFGRRMH